MADILEHAVFYTSEKSQQKRKKLLNSLAQKALNQVKEQKYAATYLLEKNAPKNILWGMAFCKKECIAVAEIVDSPVR